MYTPAPCKAEDQHIRTLGIEQTRAVTQLQRAQTLGCVLTGQPRAHPGQHAHLHLLRGLPELDIRHLLDGAPEFRVRELLAPLRPEVLIEEARPGLR